MGQVIHYDFAARTARTQSDVSVAGSAGLVDGAGANLLAGTDQAAPPPCGDRSLVERCDEMRAQSDSLQAAMDNLRQATAELDRLPALARALCESVA